ncbi:hypothetical protein G5B40_17240 [Pikeienuella piscinae]|uniref:Uncharacterized protein n=1 Tax=Pikeienuella piscinae TaxID=2748098 RepID=A0A7L5C4Z3_9RHOB|nr:hypothetical protein [Pikeienuella piscinae]QIE57029.1 hypothetical protein G5B40_17240 [Pikeienuella piscinae]
MEVWTDEVEGAATDSPARAAAANDEAPSVAVLPFREIGPPADDFFAEGVVAEITAMSSAISTRRSPAPRSA